MTLRELLDFMDTTRPSAYTAEQKTAWVNDLEAVLWTQVLLQPMSLWRAYDPDEDAGVRLLLPSGWRRVYAAYLGAMIDLANGEYTQYQNSMSLYNGCVSELGAWYADLYEPAMRPARWTDGRAYAYTELTEAPIPVSVLPSGQALLALEWQTVEPFDGDGVLTIRSESGELIAEVDIISGKGGTTITRGLYPPEAGRERLYISYTGDSLSTGTGRLRVLAQPPASRRDKFT